MCLWAYAVHPIQPVEQYEETDQSQDDVSLENLERNTESTAKAK